MATITDLALSVWRRWNTPGVPESGDRDPDKAEIIAVIAAIDAALAAIGISGAVSVAKATRANLYADLAAPDGALAIVHSDTPGYSGIYKKSGAPGAGAWALSFQLDVAALADIATLASQMDAVEGGLALLQTDVGRRRIPRGVAASGDGLAYTLATSIPTALVEDTVILASFAVANEGPATLAVDGDTPRTIGLPVLGTVAKGDLQPDRVYLLRFSGSVWRVVGGDVGYGPLKELHLRAPLLLDDVDGTADAITASAPNTPAPKSTGARYTLVAAGANTGHVTLDISGSGVTELRSFDDAQLQAGDLAAGCSYDLVYVAPRYRLMSQAGGLPARARLATTDTSGYMAPADKVALGQHGVRLDAAEASLSGKATTIALGAETVNRQDADTALGGRIDGVEEDVDALGVRMYVAETKLDTVASGATANDDDEALRNRGSHTGFQSIATITGLADALAARPTAAAVDGLQFGYAGPALYPGLTPDLYAASVTDAPDAKPPMPVAWVVADAEIGVAANVPPGETLATRQPFRVDGGVVEMQFALRRRGEVTDPDGDAVQLGVQCLTAGFVEIGGAITLENVSDLTEEMGRVTRRFTLSKVAGLGVDRVAPSQAVYAVPFVKAHGGSYVRVERLSVSDATRDVEIKRQIADLDVRIAALETP